MTSVALAACLRMTSMASRCRSRSRPAHCSARSRFYATSEPNSSRERGAVGRTVTDLPPREARAGDSRRSVHGVLRGSAVEVACVLSQEDADAADRATDVERCHAESGHPRRIRGRKVRQPGDRNALEGTAASGRHHGNVRHHRAMGDGQSRHFMTVSSDRDVGDAEVEGVGRCEILDRLFRQPTTARTSVM